MHPFLVLQVNLRPLEIVPNDSPYPKNLGVDTKIKSLACSDAELLLKGLLDLLLPVEPVLGSSGQSEGLRPLEMVPK